MTLFGDRDDNVAAGHDPRVLARYGASASIVGAALQRESKRGVAL